MPNVCDLHHWCSSVRNRIEKELPFPRSLSSSFRSKQTHTTYTPCSGELFLGSFPLFFSPFLQIGQITPFLQSTGNRFPRQSVYWKRNKIFNLATITGNTPGWLRTLWLVELKCSFLDTVQDGKVFLWNYLFVLLCRFLPFSLGSEFWDTLYKEVLETIRKYFSVLTSQINASQRNPKVQNFLRMFLIFIGEDCIRMTYFPDEKNNVWIK
jgi:hypothetical protein